MVPWPSASLLQTLVQLCVGCLYITTDISFRCDPSAELLQDEVLQTSPVPSCGDSVPHASVKARV